jgi:hypothetical protein
MLSEYAAYRVGKAAGRRRSCYDDVRNDTEYQVFEFFVIMAWVIMVFIWPIHLGHWLTRVFGNPLIAIVVASTVGLIALATMVGYVVVGFFYASIWLGAFIENGKRREQMFD